MERKINCIAVDDESPALMLLEKFIKRFPELELLGTFKDSEKAYDFLKENRVDLIFSDIHMPEQSGLSFIASLDPRPLVIFSTAYSEYASDAFDLDAIDYLRKPFSFERFHKAISKVKETIRLNDLSENMSTMENHEMEYLVIKSNQQLVKVYFEEILFVEAYQEYVKIITEDKRYITFDRLKNMELLLPNNQFIRVHRSYIVSKSKVKSASGNLLEIRDHLIPVSRDLKDKVLKMLF
jgi:DNA-binding LytR/AlgR family response regulator